MMNAELVRRRYLGFGLIGLAAGLGTGSVLWQYGLWWVLGGVVVFFVFGILMMRVPKTGK